MTELTQMAHIRLTPDIYKRAQKAAAADRRTLSNWFLVIIERAVEDAESSELARQSAQAV